MGRDLEAVETPRPQRGDDTIHGRGIRHRRFVRGPNVAAGRLDGFWSTSLKPWDMAAGVLLVREAGGKVSKTDGAEFQVDVPNLLASNGLSVHQEIQQYLK